MRLTRSLIEYLDYLEELEELVAPLIVMSARSFIKLRKEKSIVAMESFFGFKYKGELIPIEIDDTIPDNVNYYIRDFLM
jgi:hypothetical protein